jgi:hypothetical protein
MEYDYEMREIYRSILAMHLSTTLAKYDSTIGYYRTICQHTLQSPFLCRT